MAQIDRALRSNIKLRHLQLVVALDEFRHLGRTSEFLAVTQPAVSKMLSEVEEMLGIQLFDRSRRGTEPTPAGVSLIRFARSVLAEYERTRDEISALEKGVAGRTRVGFMVVAMPTLLTPAIARLKSESAAATILLEEGDLTHLLPKLRIGELDLFVGRLEPGYASPDLLTETLYEEPMCLVAKPDHPLISKKSIFWKDLTESRFVVPPPWASLRVKLEQQFFRHGLQPPEDVIETASFLGQITIVREQSAIALMARSVAEHFSTQGFIKQIKLNVDIDVPPVGMITVRGRQLTPITQRLIEILRDRA
ncbi:LysR family transcriptional regulator [Orrella sp. NBD-18]|uniref:LysR family transcriptional regulator n=1 Tax=Sheuella amnicola TaxID=2707330 RepID=A0A6B2QX97_9BURK|nr:LysR substrate-binding domain-containing protein [Sheuella amnicola]NDY83070.1 LysR family transcriptional regulator [Sheuella amnicola]